MTEPSLHEVMRQISDLVQQVRDLVQEVRSDYVRKDVYDAKHDVLVIAVKKLETESDAREKTAADTRRQFVFLVLSLAIPAVFGLLLSVYSYMAMGR